MRIFVPSRMFSAKDEASHTKLKFRCAPAPAARPPLLTNPATWSQALRSRIRRRPTIRFRQLCHLSCVICL